MTHSDFDGWCWRLFGRWRRFYIAIGMCAARVAWRLNIPLGRRTKAASCYGGDEALGFGVGSDTIVTCRECGRVLDVCCSIDELLAPDPGARPWLPWRYGGPQPWIGWYPEADGCQRHRFPELDERI